MPHAVAMHLRNRGLVAFPLPQQTRVILDSALDKFEHSQRFRFPDIDALKQPYSSEYKFAFNSLYRLSVDVFEQVCANIPDYSVSPGKFSDLPFPANCPEQELPFQSKHPLGTSFFNLFNYDFGSLNAHKDRGWITVTYCRPRPANVLDRSDVVKLWVQDHSGNWVDADSTCLADNGHIIVMAGEALENASGGYYKAVDHSVRVNPTGSFLSNSHFKRDPAYTFQHVRSTRLSAAFILDLNI